MATHQFSVLGPSTLPDSSGDVFQQPYSLIDSGTVLDPLIFAFNDSGAKDGLRGVFLVPQNYVGSAKWIVLWAANATSGNAIWDLSYLTRSDDEDMGAAATDTTDTVTTTVAGTAFLLNTSSMTLTAADFVAGDIVPFELFRDGVNDTMAATAAVFVVLFEYADA